MPTLTVHKTLWNELENVARKRHLSAQKLATVALREYLQRTADDELLQHSQRVGQRASFAIQQSEQLVRRHRSQKISDPPTP